MRKAILGMILLIIGWAFVPASEEFLISEDTPVAELLTMLGEESAEKQPDFSVGNVSAEIGEDIVKNGFSSREGFNKSKRQSKHFVCTSCHNTVREDPVLGANNPQDRLLYSVENGIPFLQATTLWGAVNRETYYNGDYYKKYGDLVKPARHSIREAIQLCAVECAQGRILEDWELESILAYLWTLELKVSDLGLSEKELQSVQLALENDKIQKEANKLIKTKYATKSDATFIEPPSDRREGYGLEGNLENGKLIYEQSCLHCHYQKRYSYLNLDDTKMTFKYLSNKAPTYSRFSIYQVVRYGTFSKHGKKSYMPLYTEEKMDDQQMEDLRAYISYRAAR